MPTEAAAQGASVRQAGLALRWRLLIATLAALLIALALAGAVLQRLFRDHVMRQFDAQLISQLDQLTAGVDLDAQGQAMVARDALSDPRFAQALGGLYWQVETRGPQSAGGAAPELRSRSLWDQRLMVPADEPMDGEVHHHELRGPGGTPVLAVERLVHLESTPNTGLRLTVAGDLAPIETLVADFSGDLVRSLLALLALLATAAVAQVVVGLAPLRALTQAVQKVRDGQALRVDGRFPAEVQPLVDDFNDVLARQAASIERARAQAGNLAHAIKTPLAVLQQEAARDPPNNDGAVWSRLVTEQVRSAKLHVDWHLRRARAAAASVQPGQSTAAAPIAAGLVRVMQRVHAQRALHIALDVEPEDLAFAGEEQDLQEMLGNLLDNACKWAQQHVSVTGRPVESTTGRLRLTVDDDGPGIAPAARAAALDRGVRLDESVPGTGLGLSIVNELAALYGGSLSLESAPRGGLRAVLVLPRKAG